MKIIFHLFRPGRAGERKEKEREEPIRWQEAETR